MTDQEKKERAVNEIDGVVQGSEFLVVDLGIAVVESVLHPDWVILRFPFGSTPAASRSTIDQAIINLLRVGGEPAFVGGVLLPGDVYINFEVALVALRKMESGLSITDSVSYSEFALGAQEPTEENPNPQPNYDLQWREILAYAITDGRF